MERRCVWLPGSGTMGTALNARIGICLVCGEKGGRTLLAGGECGSRDAQTHTILIAARDTSARSGVRSTSKHRIPRLALNRVSIGRPTSQFQARSGVRSSCDGRSAVVVAAGHREGPHRQAGEGLPHLQAPAGIGGFVAHVFALPVRLLRPTHIEAGCCVFALHCDIFVAPGCAPIRAGLHVAAVRNPKSLQRKSGLRVIRVG